MRLYAEEHGDGPPLLLLTGIGSAIWAWQRQLPDWSRSFRCIAVDNRGSGRSPKPTGPTSIEEMADDAAEVLDGRRAHVCGYSMGGYLAQALALRHPDLVDRLVLLSTATGGPDIVPTPAETRAAWLENADRTPEEFARATMPLSFRPSWTDEHPEEFEKLLRDRLEFPTPPECWRAQFEACVDWTSRLSPVEEVTAPTLVIHGDVDRIVAYENGLVLAGRLPNARFETFAGAGHLLFIEEPQRLNTMVTYFLTD